MRTDYVAPSELEIVYRALTPANELVCRLCEETGLRVGDALSLKTDALKARLTVTEQKTGKTRRVHIRKALLEALQAQSGEQYVFEGRLSKDRHRTRQAVWKDIKRAATAFRLPQNVAPHSIRKTYAVELAKRGYDVSAIQKRLNHESAEVTALYLIAGFVSMSERPFIPPPRYRSRATGRTERQRKAQK